MRDRRIRASRGPERQFGLGVGGVFLALGSWSLWRGSLPTAVGEVLAAGGLVLVVLGLVFPALLVWPRRGWMAMAEVLSAISTRVMLGVVFYVGILPVGLVMRAFGWDPLAGRTRGRPTHWVDYPSRQRDPKHFEQMF